MSSKDNLALDLEHGVRRWDRARWISVFSSHNPTIREVTECLGLGLSASSSTTNRGIPKFDNPDYRKLSSEVTKLSKELPKERDALLDFAADPQSLDTELEELLGTYGPAIWSKDADRSCLLTPDPTKKTYTKDLFYEDLEHKDILKIHLHRWIIIKACYYIRNMKLKRPSGAGDGEYDTIADIEGNSQMSPHGTPHSLTPPEHDATPGADLDVKPIIGKKRKSEAFGSWSDGEEHSATPNKRPYSTMPINRGSKSPRKSLYGILPHGHGSLENVPPLPVKRHPSQSPAGGAEPARIQLSPLSNSELNGTSRQVSVPPTTAAGGFNAVNSNAFPTGNNAPTLKSELSRDGSRPPSTEMRPASPTSRDARAYTSPYDPSSSRATAKRAHESSLHLQQQLRHKHRIRRVLSTSMASHDASLLPTEVRIMLLLLLNHSHMPTHIHRQQLMPLLTILKHMPILLRRLSHEPSIILSALVARVAPAVLVILISGDHSPLILSVDRPAAQHHQPRQATILKSQASEAPPAVARPAAVSTVELRALQCEVTAMLLHWLFPKPSHPPDEAGLLHRMNTLWYHGEPIFRPELGAHFDLTSHVLTAWLQERYAIASLQHALATHPGLPSSSAAIIDRLLAMNDLRAMRLKWKNMSPVDGMSPEDILIRAFCVMTMTEHTEFVFKEGLGRVERNVFEFLRTEDAKIILHRQ
ncbi:hypothetical protein DE146DRAFT_611707 [Phaeosphaeria sp. MPI-PUGE-AT-0046c]|nr:hypothetical protein DE146DRAFT_611707 [Phaeosphaeria sp. MPI-PUGE-AT-0046c]